MAERDFGELKGVYPDPKKIKCKDCFYRDKTKVKLGNKIIESGITKSFCVAYPKPPDSNGKPYDVLFQNADCRFYEKDSP